MKTKVISMFRNNFLTKNKKSDFADYENIPCAIMISKADGKIVYANKFTEDILQIKKEILLSSTLFNLIPKQNHQNLTKALDDVSKKHKVQNLIVPMVTNKNNKNALFEIVLNANSIDEIIITISELASDNEANEKLIKKTESLETELDETKNLLEKITDNLPVALFIKKYPEGKYITWNKKSEEIFNRKAIDVIGQTRHDEITKEQDDFFTNQDKKVFETKQEIEIPKEIISTKKNNVRILHTVKTPVFDDKANPLYLIGISDDITLKTKTEKKLKDSSSKYQMLIKNIKKGVLIIQKENIIFANNFMSTILKKPETELMDSSIFDIIPQKNKTNMQEILEKIINPSSTQKDSVLFDIELEDKMGEKIPVKFYGMESVYLGKKVLICFFRTKDNISKEKKSKQNEKLLLKFQNVFRSNNHPLAIMNHNGYLSRLNEKAQEIFGFTKQDKNFYTNIYILPMFKLQARKSLKENKETNTMSTVDFDNLKKQFPNRIKKSGKMKLKLNLIPLDVENKNTDWLISMEQPSSIENSQVSSQIRLACFKEPFFICNEKREIIDHNLPAKELLFFNDEIEGLTLENIFVDEDNPKIKKTFKELKELKSIKNLKYKLKQQKEDGSFKNLSVNISASIIPVKNPKKPNNYIFIINNFSKKHEVLDSLKLETKKHQALLKCIEDIICFADIKNNSSLTNFKDIYNANNFLGYTKKELEMLNMEDILTKPEKSKTSSAKIFLKERIKELDSNPTLSFITKAYNKNKKEIIIKVWVSKINLKNKNQLLIVIRDITSSFNLDVNLQKTQTELENLISTLPDVYIKTDIEGNIQDYLVNKKTFEKVISKKDALTKNIKTLIPKGLYENLMFNIKECLSNNSFHMDTYQFKTKNTEKYIEVQFIPLIKEQEVVILIKNANYKKEFETKIQSLAKMAITQDKKFTEKLDSIISLGQKIFKTQTGFLMRFIDDKTGYIAYSSSKNNMFKRGPIHNIPTFLMQVLDDKIVSSQNIKKVDFKNTMLGDENVKSIVAAPIHIASKVKGCLCFADMKENIKQSNIDKEFLGLIASLISQSLEIRQGNKILSDRKNLFKHMIDQSEIPSLIIDDKYNIEYINPFFAQLTNCKANKIKGKNLFEQFFFNEYNYAQEDFEKNYLSTKENIFQIYTDMAITRTQNINITMTCIVLENKFGKADNYVIMIDEHK